MNENPRIMVQAFLKDYLGAKKVLRTMMQAFRSEQATRFVKKLGVLIGNLKKVVVEAEFCDKIPKLGLRDQEIVYPFLRLCTCVAQIIIIIIHRIFKVYIM